MKRNTLLGACALLVILVLLLLYIGLTAGSDLMAARTVLSGEVTQLSPADMRGARERLGRALKSLDALPARALGTLPMIGHNLRAADDVAGAALDVLDSALALHRAVEDAADAPLIAGGRIEIPAIRRLQGPVKREIVALAGLEQQLNEHRNGWVLPLVWDAFDDGAARVHGVRLSAQRALRGLELAGAMLGTGGPRTYLVILLNNAELRGAGGIPSGAGTIVADDGELRLGDFRYTVELRGPRNRRVRAPEEFVRRFGQYGADTTLWVNTTFSPDVPDVATVAGRLFEVATGTAVDGVILADPRGVSALLPPQEILTPPGTGRTLTAEELPRFAYSDAYRLFEKRSQPLRRDTLLAVGKAAFETFLEQARLDRASLERIGASAAGGHLRMVMFEPREQALLEEIGIAGALEPPTGDSLLVTAQNFGGDKLDYFARRKVAHDCEVSETIARCVTDVTLINRTPPRLPPYMAGLSFGEVYGLLRSFVELYVPERARVTSVELDRRPATYFAEQQAGHAAVGALIEVPRGRQQTLSVAYDLPLEGGYELKAVPQPLARDAELTVSLQARSGWTLRGPGRKADEGIHFEGLFDRTMEFTAAPKRARGLTGMWTRLVRFWNEPLF